MVKDFTEAERLRVEPLWQDAPLQTWPTEEIMVMGQLPVPVAPLLERNDLASRASDYSPTIVRFGVYQPTLEVHDLKRRFDSDVAKIVGLLLLREPGMHERTALTEDIVKRFAAMKGSAQASIGTAVMSLRYSLRDQEGTILVVDRNALGLREDLVFLPSVDAHLQLVDTAPGSKVVNPERQTAPIKARARASRDAHDSEAPSPELTEKVPVTLGTLLYETDETTKIALLAAYDFIFMGGELPVATDVLTYNAFQKAIQEIGGHMDKESTSRITQHYLGKNVQLTDDIQQRIQELGESLHVKAGRNTTVALPYIKASAGAADRGWTKKAACLGIPVDAYFPESEVQKTSQLTQAVLEACSKCVVRSECLEYALNTGQTQGIWGGLFEEDIRSLKKTSRAAVQKLKK